MNAINDLLSSIRQDSRISGDIAHLHYDNAREGDFKAIPDVLHPTIKNILTKINIQKLYSHQVEAWETVRKGKNVIIASGTASGKSLCYNLPILQGLIECPNQTALYIFPTRALAQDQIKTIYQYRDSITGNDTEKMLLDRIKAYIYDGDTPSYTRPLVKNNANLILTNPDMLHIGILPHHTTWKRFFEYLKFVVIDEAHIYRGIFGSHMANLVRRLSRICAFYGGNPQFILTSATIANPKEHAEKLVQKPCRLIDRDGSPFRGRNHILINPTVIHEHLGIRRSASQEASLLSDHLLSSCGMQTIVFTRSRRSVELLLKEVTGRHSDARIMGYRSGYLASERRAIEEALKSGLLNMAISTNALELGMDIGGVDVVVTIGYPGTIAAYRQQSGRAGRRDKPATAVFIASQLPIDQYLINHPDYLLSHPVELALINPDNLAILFAHTRCALFELPFTDEDGFGSLDANGHQELIQSLIDKREARQALGRTMWTGSAYPAQQVSLRSIGGNTVNLYVENDDGSLTRIGEVDHVSAPWMVHNGAIYMHQGDSFLVDDLDIERGKAIMRFSHLDYFTQPIREQEISLVQTIDQSYSTNYKKWTAQIMVSSLVTGYKKISWSNRETIGSVPLTMMPQEYLTEGLGLSFSPSLIEKLRNQGEWNSFENDYGPGWQRIREKVRRRDGFRCKVCGVEELSQQQHHVHHIQPFKAFTKRQEANSLSNLMTLCPGCHRAAERVVLLRSGLTGLAYLIHNLAPLFLMCDPGDLDRYSEPESKMIDGGPMIVIFEVAPGGTGLSHELFIQFETLLESAVQLMMDCPCQDGCPGCVGPGGEAGLGGKQETIALLKEITGQTNDR